MPESVEAQPQLHQVLGHDQKPLGRPIRFQLVLGLVRAMQGGWAVKFVGFSAALGDVLDNDLLLALRPVTLRSRCQLAAARRLPMAQAFCQEITTGTCAPID